ncbi:MAG: response regulator transcription factor [Bacteroidetes bacterium]|nr:response regulator transcription factor [Bacteroidota bacterium]
MISVLIADKYYLSRVGLMSLLNESSNFNADYTAESNFEALMETIRERNPKILVIDFQSFGLSAKHLAMITRKFKKLQILAITDYLTKTEMQAALDAGVRSYLLKECDKEEIIEALHATYNGERFLCGKVAYFLSSPETAATRAQMSQVSCEGLGITDREIDVIRLIAEGLSNKQIADKLCLSTHTVNTHRKNLMNKLQVNNTAGVLMFAVKNNLLAEELV